MITVKKGNIELNIDETEESKFLDKGYDRIDGSGEVVKKATGGKTVSIEEYNELRDKYDELKKKFEEKSAEPVAGKSTKKKSTAEGDTEASAE